MFLAALILGSATIAYGVSIIQLVVAVWLVLVGFLVSPAFFPRSGDLAEAQAEASARQVPLIYWKPGCTWCIRLRARLALTGTRTVWIDIWRYPAAAEAVRRLNNGDETTPTVTYRDQSRTNPDPGWVRDLLRGG